MGSGKSRRGWTDWREKSGNLRTREGTRSKAAGHVPGACIKAPNMEVVAMVAWSEVGGQHDGECCGREGWQKEARGGHVQQKVHAAGQPGL